MPVWFMISPARMKNGMARKGKRLRPAKKRFGAIDRKLVPPASMIPARPAMPSTKPIGMPRARRVKKMIRTMIMAWLWPSCLPHLAVRAL